VDSENPDSNRPITVTDIEGLRSDVKVLAGEASFLREYGYRNRLLIRLAFLSLIFDIGLTGWVIFNTIHASDIGNSANKAVAAAVKNQETQYASCLATNKVRDDARSLWEYVISTNEVQIKTLPADQQAQEQQIIKVFEAKVNSTYAQQNCSPSSS
jgi:hypothetical protein